MKRKLPIIIFSLLIIVGVIIMFFPYIMNLFNKNENRNIIISYTNKVAKGDDKTKEYIWSLAEQYNKSLSSVKIVDSFYKEDDKLSDEYLKLLNFDSDGLIGYIKIPKINIELPIYHGTNTKTLEKRNRTF